MSETNEIINPDEFADLSKYRILVYNLFSRVFARKPDGEFLESLAPAELIKTIGGLCENEGDAKDLQKTVEDILSNSDEFTRVQEDFEELFVIPARDKFIPPYISYYMGNEPKRVQTEVAGEDSAKGTESCDLTLTDKLESMYKTFNFTLKNSYEITLKRPDHISYIFGFMGALIGLEERYRLGQVENRLPFKEVMENEYMFFNEFIENWTGLFASEIIEKAGSPFYVTAARLLQSFIGSEQRDYRSILLFN